MYREAVLNCILIERLSLKHILCREALILHVSFIERLSLNHLLYREAVSTLPFIDSLSLNHVVYREASCSQTVFFLY